MKRLLILLVCGFFVTMMSFAQDIIVKKDAQQIECVVSDVTPSEVLYKTSIDQQGYFVMRTSEIKLILFQDGSVKDFSSQQPPVSSIQQPPVSSVQKIEYSDAIKKVETKLGYFYVLNSETGPIHMDEAAYVKFIQANSPEAWKKYRQSNMEIISGWSLMGAGGIFCFVVGLPMIICTYYEGSATAFLNIGSAGVLASIPVLSVGYGTKKRNYKYYNEYTRYKKQYSLNIQSSKDGIGLAFHF